jgi:hypothetical protein
MRLYSIRTRTAIVLFTISLLIVLFLGGLWVYSTYQTMKSDIGQSNLQDARLIAGYVQVFINDIANDERVVAASPYTHGFGRRRHHGPGR